MKIQVRRGVFETNSSSTHSLTMCSESEYERWVNGELYLDYYENTFTTYESIVEELKKDVSNENLNFDDEKKIRNEIEKYGDYITHDKYFGDSYLESFHDSYTANSGERIVAFGKFGFDG